MSLLSIFSIFLILNLFYFLSASLSDYFLGEFISEAALLSINISLSCFILVVLCFYYAKMDGVRIGSLALKNINKAKTYIWAIIGFGSVLAFYFTQNVIFDLLKYTPGTYDRHLEKINIAGKYDSTLLLITGVIFIPFAEEILFRGFIYQYLRKTKSIFVATVITSTVFAILHMGFHQFVGTFFGGIVLVIAYEITQTLAAPIIIHALVNTVALSYFLISYWS